MHFRYLAVRVGTLLFVNNIFALAALLHGKNMMRENAKDWNMAAVRADMVGVILLYAIDL